MARAHTPNDEDDTPRRHREYPAPHPLRPHSRALQRQVALLESTTDPKVDYFLFDDMDQPIKFAVNDHEPHGWMRWCFTFLLEDALSGPQDETVGALAEYMIVKMADKPGLSEAGILAQFAREYGINVAFKMGDLRRKKIHNGYDLEKTFLESLSVEMPKKVMTSRPTGS